MNGKYEIGDYVLSNWKLIKVLGAGAYGKVYEAQREEYGVTYKAAIKIITIPQSVTEVQSARSEGMTDVEVSEYFEDIVRQIVNECAFMSKVKGITNIVGYEDHMVVPHERTLGWDVIIRMELLTPLLEHVIYHVMSPRDVAKLGIDICKALEVCQKMNIIHRDIKPENMMISNLGDYKLGDFGISRTIEKTQGGLSKKGTASYMAPEVAKGEAYGPTVDIYSLGIVMYRFLNDNRGPFLPPPPAVVKFNDREEAQNRRISGEAIPPPKQADSEFARIVLKACAYEAKDRYQTPGELKKDLQRWLRECGTAQTDAIEDDVDEGEYEEPEETISVMDSAETKEKAIPENTEKDALHHEDDSAREDEMTTGWNHFGDQTGNGEESELTTSAFSMRTEGRKKEENPPQKEVESQAKKCEEKKEGVHLSSPKNTPLIITLIGLIVVLFYGAIYQGIWIYVGLIVVILFGALVWYIENKKEKKPEKKPTSAEERISDDLITDSEKTSSAFSVESVKAPNKKEETQSGLKGKMNSPLVIILIGLIVVLYYGCVYQGIWIYIGVAGVLILGAVYWFVEKKKK